MRFGFLVFPSFFVVCSPVHPASSVHPWVPVLIPYPREILIIWSQSVKHQKHKIIANSYLVPCAGTWYLVPGTWYLVPGTWYVVKMQVKCQRTGYEITKHKQDQEAKTTRK